MDIDLDIRSLAVLVGVLLQLAGVAVVIYQLRRVNTSIRVSAQAALYQQSAGIRSLLVEHPDLRPYLFDGVEIANGDEHYARARTVAEMMLNYLEHLVIQQDSLRASEHSAWRRFVKRSVAASPLMQQVLDESPCSYSDELLRVRRRLATRAG